ncbi:hypothetical protein AgCh_008403 [Apium graveolens]
MKEVTLKNVKCKTGGLIPRKGDARYERYPNIEGIQEERFKDNLRGFTRRKDEVVERKMLGPAVVQRTKDLIDLIRGRLVVAQDGHKKYVDLTRKEGPSVVIGIPLEGVNEIRKERKAKSTNCWTLGYIKTFWEVSI